MIEDTIQNPDTKPEQEQYINPRGWTQDLSDLNDKAKPQRKAYEQIWKDIDENFFPYQSTKNNQGITLNKSKKRKSSVPETVLSSSVAMAVSYIIPPTESGMQIQTMEKEISHEDKAEISKANNMVIDKLHQTGSKDNSLYQSLYPATEEALVYGNGAILIEYEADKTDPIISAINIREVYLLADYKTGIIHTIFRESMTNTDLSTEEIVEVWRDMSYDYKGPKMPLVINDPTTYPINYRKYAKNGGQILDNKVYSEMPIRYGRMFLKPGHIYGSGLGQRALTAAKRYHALIRQQSIIIDRLGRSPLAVIKENFKDGKINLKSDAINELNSTIQGTPQIMPLFQINPAAVQATEIALQKCEMEIRQALMESSLMIPGETLDKMTATAVTFYSDQKNSLIAPALIGMTSSILHGMARIQLYRLIERGVINFSKNTNIEDLQFSFLSKQDMMRKRVDANLRMQQITTILQIANNGYSPVMELTNLDSIIVKMLKDEGVEEEDFIDEDTIRANRAQRQETIQNTSMQQAAAESAQ